MYVTYRFLRRDGVTLKPYVLHFDQIDRTGLPDVGGKGANLGEMSRAGFPVPRGFCITTRAYKEVTAAS
ncbi:MAG: PEP/pyruvate-binding domain-containing protein, partial [Desulfotomaculaceae bacterium]|nr:PEP/pyruvate-binding domain-containing protein [Desulfotomaculaceae bacterium]